MKYRPKTDAIDIWKGRKAFSILLTLTPRRPQAINKPKSGIAQAPVNTREIIKDGRSSGCLKVWKIGVNVRY